MNMALWLRKGSTSVTGFRSEDRGTDKYMTAAGTGEKSVFIALPRKAKLKYTPSPSLPTHHFTYVSFPEKERVKSSVDSTVVASPRKGLFSAAVISFFSLILSVFAAIGLLNILASSLRLPVYPQGNMLLEKAVHKPGSGPAPEDAVINEYQNALTREMVSAADTTGENDLAERNTGVNGILGEIQISEEKNLSTPKSGTAPRKLKIFNSTKRTLDRVVVQIEVLGKEGRLLRTESHTAENMAPMAVREFEVTDILPDAEVHCYVQEVRSKSLRTMLRSL